MGWVEVTVLTLLPDLGKLRKIANMVASPQCVLRNMTLCSVELGDARTTLFCGVYGAIVKVAV
jgi:hypothetical protein